MSDAPAPDDSAAMLDAHTVPVLMRAYARVENGFVVEMKRVAGYARHPFGDEHKDARVIDATGVPCAVGYIADDRGNVGPAQGRTEGPSPYETAYHDRSVPAAPPVAVTAAQLGGGEPHPLVQGEPDAGEVDAAGVSTKGRLDAVATRQEAAAQEPAADKT